MKNFPNRTSSEKRALLLQLEFHVTGTSLSSLASVLNWMIGIVMVLHAVKSNPYSSKDLD